MKRSGNDLRVFAATEYFQNLIAFTARHHDFEFFRKLIKRILGILLASEKPPITLYLYILSFIQISLHQKHNPKAKAFKWATKKWTSEW